MMRRATGVLLSLLLLNAVSLRSGVFCEFAAAATQHGTAAVGEHGEHGMGGEHQLRHAAGHDHQAPNVPLPRDGTAGHENSSSEPSSLSQCVLMLLCAQSSVAAAHAEAVASAPAAPRVLVLTTRAPESLSAAPEPPPPKR